jgi:hypothetical protein
MLQGREKEQMKQMQKVGSHYSKIDVVLVPNKFSTTSAT